MAWTERYVDASASGGGTGTSASDPWTLAEGFANVSSGQRVNIKAGTYTTSSALNIGVSNVVFRGYTTTIGDLDSVSPSTLRVAGTDIPKVTGTTRAINNTSYITNATIQNISFEYNAADTLIYINNMGDFSLLRCRVINSNSAGRCTLSRYSFFQIVNCYLHNASTTVDVHQTAALGGSTAAIVRSVISGGSTGSQGPVTRYVDSLFINQSAIAINGLGYAQQDIHGCSFYNAGSHFISAGGANLFVSRCVFDTCGGYAISITGSNYCLANNAYYDSSFTSGRVSTSDGDDFEAVTLSSSPFVDAAGNDFAIDSTSPIYQPKFLYENGQASYSDIGAIQHVPVVDSSQPQEAGTQVMPFGQWAVTNPEAQLHPLRSS